MIRIDFNNGTYTCPFCGHDQAFSASAGSRYVGLHMDDRYAACDKEDGPAALEIHWFTCSNNACGKTCVTSVNRYDHSRHDIYPEVTYLHFPKYIPSEIRSDYEEACQILGRSPKAAATMFRRCLQGMIRDFHQIVKPRLIDEVNALKARIPASQWSAIDAVRQIGNIGAHMEKDVNQIVEVDEGEADALRRMIELLMRKWYVARHDEEELCKSLCAIAKSKRA